MVIERKENVARIKSRIDDIMASAIRAVCIGRDMEEAFIVAQVLEKASKTFIEAEFIGGAKSVGKFNAMYKHQYYLRKYSKQKK